MAQSIIHVDSFTNQPFAGNPAGVCILPEPGDPAWMQTIAREMSLSETAFLHQQEDGYSLRWFTPTTEVDLCGHATLASAHVLWEQGHLQADEQARFQTRSGLLTASRNGDWIELDFPAIPEHQTVEYPHLSEALGVRPMYVGKNQMDYLIEVATEEMVRQMKPDFPLLRKVPIRGVMVTSRASSPGYDFVSRFFAPAVGIDEDPVTGSAHCCLGPFWGERLGKDELVGYQASARGGVVRVRLDGDRVLIGGQAVTVIRGELV
ncbi:MAG: oxidoreductase [Candidatus Chloroheliales bacterium]|nr:MAG: oxidoreductase [Chloroflexota bacterium]